MLGQLIKSKKEINKNSNFQSKYKAIQTQSDQEKNIRANRKQK